MGYATLHPSYLSGLAFCGGFIHRVALTLAYRHHHNHQHAIAHFINQAIARFPEFDFEPVFCWGYAKQKTSQDASIYETSGAGKLCYPAIPVIPVIIFTQACE